MCEKLGVNAWEVIDAAATKPFGFMKFTPGPGLGGHCIPIDPHYLSWKLKTLDYDARFINLAGEINTYMPKHIVELIISSLNEYQKPIKESKILIIGVAYKKNINDCRESPALDIIQLLKNAGARINYYDTLVSRIDIEDEYVIRSKNLKPNQLKKYDVCVIITDHGNIDYEIIYQNCQLIIDTRNVYHNKNGKHLIRLGQG